MKKVITNDKKEDKKKHGFRYCPICGNKLSKDGFDERGKQRYYCSTCKTSKRLKDNRQNQEKLICIVSNILLKGITAELACKN